MLMFCYIPKLTDACTYQPGIYFFLLVLVFSVSGIHNIGILCTGCMLEYNLYCYTDECVMHKTDRTLHDTSSQIGACSVIHAVTCRLTKSIHLTASCA